MTKQLIQTSSLLFGLFLVFLSGCEPASVESYDLIIKNGRVIDPESGLDEVINIAIKDEIRQQFFHFILVTILITLL